MAFAQAQFIFGANHAHRDFASNLTFFNFKRLTVFWIKQGANSRYNDFLASGHIGRAANNGQRLFSAHLYGGQRKLVGIGVGDAGLHLTDNKTCQATWNGFVGFLAFYL